MITEDSIKILLNSIVDPDLGRTLGEVGAIHEVKVDGPKVQVFLELVQPIHWIARQLDKECTSTIIMKYPEAEVEVFVKETGFRTTEGAGGISGVKNLIAIASGKGGVGKSTLSANFAAALAQQGATVGLLDADIYGPSQPTMYGVAGEQMRAEKSEDGKLRGYPIERHGVKLASIGFVMARDQAAILRGPMLAGYFSTLVDQIEWGELDFLIFDLPPGTGDIQLTMTQRIPLTGAVVVTTPQEISLADVRRSVQMFKKVNVDVLGFIENMSYFTPPDAPDKKYYIFGEGGGKLVSKEFNVPLLGEIPIDMRIREGADAGIPFVMQPEAATIGDAFRDIAAATIAEVRKANASAQDSHVSIEL